jgi:tetratricopeptide (TPR) repeat protein
VRPSHPAELGFSYYEASLVCEMIERDRGRAALVAILKGYRDGLDTPAVLRSVLGLTPEALDARFTTWLRERFAGPLAAIAPWDGKSPAGGEFIAALRAGRELLEQQRLDEARAALERAAALFPEYAGAGAPELLLARVYLAKGDRRAAAAALSRHTARDESAWDANAEEARLREAIGDPAGAAAALERMLWISPYDADVHQRLANLAEGLHDYRRALRERRANVALGPADLLEARYQVARALAQSGDVAAARREVLRVLETAPGFEKAQALLLELRKQNPEENHR